jgi:hypothetical protein
MIDAEDDFPVGLNDKTCLIITASYPSEDESFYGGVFVKYQVAELRRYFKKFIVISPVLQSFRYLKNDKL